MATKSDNIRYTQLKQQIVDIYEKASAGITNENELDKSVINALNDGSFDVFYGDQLTGLKPQKFDFILNPEDHPADHIDYYDGEVIDKPQQAMSWELYLDTYKTEDPYSVILVRKKTEHTNPHIQQAKLGTMIKGEDYRKELYKIQKEIGKIYNECENEVDKRWGSFDFKNNPSALEKYTKEVDDLFLVKLQENGYGVFKNAKGVTLQKLDILLNGQDYPSVRVDYYNGVHIIGYRERLKQEEYFSYYPEAILVRKKQEQAKLGTNIKTKRMRKQTLSQKANYVPNRMINEVEVERNGKVTFVDGANILDGVYVKKGVKYEDGGQMNETFPDVDGEDNMSFMAGGKVGKMKLKTIADLVANEKAVKDFLTKKIKENYLKGTTFKTDDYIEGSWEQDDANFEMEELIGKDVYEYVSEDEADTYMELVNAWRDGIAVKLGGSSRKINAEWDGVSGDKRAKEIIDNLGESNDYNPGTKADLKNALTKYLAKKSKDIGDEDFQDMLLNASYLYGFDMDDDGEEVADDVFDMIENEESVTAIMKYLENVNKAKRGTNIKTNKMKRKFIDYDEYDYKDESIFDKKPDLIVKNNVDDEWGDVRVWYKGKKTIVLSSDPGGYGAPALQIEGIVTDKDELLSYAKGLAGTDEEGDIFSSDTGVKDLNFYMNDWLQDLLRQFEKWGGEDLTLTLYSDKVLKEGYSDSKKAYAQRDAERKLGQILIDEGWAKRKKYKLGSDDAIIDESLIPYIKSGKAYINDLGLLVLDTDKAKRGTTIKNKQMAESTTKRRFDKMYKASKPGERKSKKFAKIERADGTTFRRRNANDSYPDGVPGGKTYSEKRPNRTDKRIYLEQGGSLGEGMGTYESTLQSNIEMGEGIEMAKRGKKIPEYNREADKQFAAMGPGERTSKRFAKIYKRDGTYFRRKNANGSYPDGVPGGLDYTENRPNRSDKRIWLEDGGSLPMEDGGSFSGEGFTYEIGGL